MIYDRKFYRPNQSLRYCMNSVSLHFIPLNLLEQNGYGEYIKLFNQMSQVCSHYTIYCIY